MTNIIMRTHDLDKRARTFGKIFIAKARKQFLETALSHGFRTTSWGVISTLRVFVTAHAARANWGV